MSRWPSWAVRPNEPSGFRGRKELLNRASALVTTCTSLICQLTSEDIKHQFIIIGSVPIPPSVPAEAGCLLLRPCSCVHLKREPTLFPGWCANKKLCYSNL